MASPYEPPRTQELDRTRADFRFIGLSWRLKAMMLGFSLVQIGCGLLAFSVRHGWPPLVLAASGTFMPLIIFPAWIQAERRVRAEPLVHGGEALYGGLASVSQQPSGSGMLLLTERELIFIRGPRAGMRAGEVQRYPLREVMSELRSSHFHTRLSFYDAAGVPSSFYLQSSETWRKAILKIAADLPAEA